MIELKHLKKEYENVCPLKDVNAIINNGDVISVIGSSGAGKTTLIRCINQLETPTSGEVWFDGIQINNPSVDIDAIRRRIGMVFQSFNLYEHLTVIENIMLGQTTLLERSREEAIHYSLALLKKVGMEEQALQYPSQLSGGQKQRAAIARTLAMDPEVILLDEPTSALDPIMTAEVEKVIENLANEGRTMVIVTHNMAFAKKISTRVFYLDEGGIYEEGTPAEIFEHPQKMKTRQFLFNENHISLIVNDGDFDLSRAIETIEGFGTKHQLGVRTIAQMKELFSIFVMDYLHSQMENGEWIKLQFGYDNEADDISIIIRHNIQKVAKNKTKNAEVQEMVDLYVYDLQIFDLQDEPSDALEEIRMTN